MKPIGGLVVGDRNMRPRPFRRSSQIEQMARAVIESHPIHMVVAEEAQLFRCSLGPRQQPALLGIIRVSSSIHPEFDREAVWLRRHVRARTGRHHHQTVRRHTEGVTCLA